jgi:hypothetical protein
MKSWRSYKMIYVSVTRPSASGSTTLTTPQQLASRRTIADDKELGRMEKWCPETESIRFFLKADYLVYSPM